jgi:hypothetical protein
MSRAHARYITRRNVDAGKQGRCDLDHLSR